MHKSQESYDITIGGKVYRSLPIVPVSESIKVAFLKLYGDTELTEVAASELSTLVSTNVDILIGPESGGILLAHLVSSKTNIPYILARKKQRPNMVQPLSVGVKTIGTSISQKLWIDDEDILKIKGKKVAIIDEVISSGATVLALTTLVEMAGGKIVQKLAVATEGEEDLSVSKLIHLPVFERKTDDVSQ